MSNSIDITMPVNDFFLDSLGFTLESVNQNVYGARYTNDHGDVIYQLPGLGDIYLIEKDKTMKYFGEVKNQGKLQLILQKATIKIKAPIAA